MKFEIDRRDVAQFTESNLRVATEEEAKAIFAEAANFITWTRFYQSVRSVAHGAVAEYIAYQRGLSLRE